MDVIKLKQMSSKNTVEDLLKWVLKKANLEFLGYKVIENSRFEFLYPNSEVAKHYFDGVNFQYHAFNIPNCSIDGAINIQGNINSDTLFLDARIVITMFNVNFNNDSFIPLVLFWILHEVGHFKHFKSFRNEAEYCSFRKEYIEKKQSIKLDRTGMSNLERQKCEFEYFSLPGELYANKYAIENFPYFWKELVDSI